MIFVVKIEKLKDCRTKSDKNPNAPYLSLVVSGLGIVQCFEKEIWSDLYTAYKSKTSIKVDVVQQLGEDGKTYKHIIGTTSNRRKF